MTLRRVGMISPPKWFCYCDDELEALNADIRVMNTQIRLPASFSYDLPEIRSAAEEVSDAAQSLANSDTDIIAQIGTPFAMVHGWEGAVALEASIESRVGVPFEMMGLSLPRVCQELGIQSVTVCTVFFTPDWTDAYRVFLDGAGLTTLYAGSFADIGVLNQYTMLESCQGHDICTLDTMIQSAERCCDRAPDAEAVLLSGLPCPQLEMIAQIEAAVGKPVISYPAVYARVLKRLGLSADTSFGRMYTTTNSGAAS